MFGQWRRKLIYKRQGEPPLRVVLLLSSLFYAFNGFDCRAAQEGLELLSESPHPLSTASADSSLQTSVLPPLQRLQHHIQIPPPAALREENAPSSSTHFFVQTAENERRGDSPAETGGRTTQLPAERPLKEKKVNYPEEQLFVSHFFDPPTVAAAEESAGGAVLGLQDAGSLHARTEGPSETRLSALALPEGSPAPWPERPSQGVDFPSPQTNEGAEGGDEAARLAATERGVIRTLVFGNIHQTAYYFADVFVGSGRPQRQSLILDTGSSVMAFPCEHCKVCGRHIDAAFQCKASPSCVPLPCSSNCTFCDARRQSCAYRVSYMEGSSLQGFWNKDIVLLPPPPPVVKQRGRGGLRSSTINAFDVSSLRSAYSSAESLRSLLASANNSQMPTPNRSPTGGLGALAALGGTRARETSNGDGNSSDATEAWGASWTRQIQQVGIYCSFGCHVEETNLFVSQRASGIWGLEVWNAFGPESFPHSLLLRALPSSARKPTPLGNNAAAETRHQEHRISGASLFHRIVAEEDADAAAPSASSVETQTGDASSSSPALTAASRMRSPVFALCLAEHGGSLSFGAAHSEFHAGPVAWTPVLNVADSYTVRLAALKVGGVFVALREQHSLEDAARLAAAAEQRAARQGAFSGRAEETDLGSTASSSIEPRDSFTVLIDSGSTLAYFPKELYVHLVQAIEEYLVAHRGGGRSRRLGEEKLQASAKREETESLLEATPGRLKRPLLGEAVEVGGDGGGRALGPDSTEERLTSIPEASTDAPRRLQQRTAAPKEEERPSSPQSETSAAASPLGVEIFPNPFASRPSSTLHPSAASAVAAFNAAQNGLFSVRRADPHAASSSPSEPQRRSKAPANSSAVSAESLAGGGEFGSQLWADANGGGGAAAAAALGEGSEVPDSEALPIFAALSAVPPDAYSEQAAYELLPPSAPRRKSQAIKVETSAGEVCYFLPRSRQDLAQFPLIELLFWPTASTKEAQEQETASGAKGGGGEESASSALWVEWQPSSYLYSKGNEHYRCLALSDDASSRDSAVLGSSFFIGKDVIVDIEKERIGFAAAQCPSIRLRDRPDLPRLATAQDSSPL